MTCGAQIIKRIIDLCGAAVALLLFSPLLAVLAVWIRGNSRGPALFRQERAGRNATPFILFKFRTMQSETDPFGDSPSAAADPRLTSVGRRLRESSLDELPQLWNVLRGDMSLVGPRPLYLSQVRDFTARQKRRLEVRPGLTGLAQLAGRGELPHAEKLELNVQYVENASLWLDLKILARTVIHVFSRRQIYQKWS